MGVEFKEKDNKKIAFLSGALKSEAVSDIDSPLSEYAEENQSIYLDFSNVPFITSAFIRLVLQLGNILFSKNGTIYVQNCNKNVKDVLYLTGISNVVVFI
ncbi:MAG: STAS domain-containing protein [Alphaproteobacteria bacterium]|nr:STAS domain-containing protein [Alphaproteobacteria bacterium]